MFFMINQCQFYNEGQQGVTSGTLTPCLENKFRFYGRGAGSVKNIISAIENDKEDFLDDFK